MINYTLQKQTITYNEGQETVQDYVSRLRAYEQSVETFKNSHSGLNYYEDDNCIIMYANSEQIIDGEIVDISQTPEYIAEQEAKAKEAKRIEIQKQIDELDKKRIRALAEGGEKETGLTWLEYYNEQIRELRSLI